jgi:hypothetical protein
MWDNEAPSTLCRQTPAECWSAWQPRRMSPISRGVRWPSPPPLRILRTYVVSPVASGCFEQLRGMSGRKSLRLTRYEPISLLEHAHGVLLSGITSSVISGHAACQITV